MPTRTMLDAETAGRFVRLALDCVGREYPNHPLTLLTDDGDALPPRRHTPAFFGCFDWHSAVHAHWTLARLAGRFPEADWAPAARAAVARSLTPANLAAEVPAPREARPRRVRAPLRIGLAPVSRRRTPRRR